jgi:hypothetical protein
LSLLSSLDFTIIEYYQKNESNLNQIILKRVLNDFEDDDYRVREQASQTLIDILPVLLLKKEPEIITFQRLISDKKDLITDREIQNLNAIMEMTLNQFKIAEKTKIDGYLKFWGLVGEKYTSMIKDFSEEIVDEMIDFLRFKENNFDLNSQIQTINNIRLFFCKSRTGLILPYILFILNLLNEFRTTVDHDIDKTNWHGKSKDFKIRNLCQKKL